MAALVVTLGLAPRPAFAAAGTMTTTAQAARVHLALLNGLGSVNVTSPAQQTWTTGGATATASIPAQVGSLINIGAVVSTAQPVTGGGRAESDVAGATVVSSSTLSVGAIESACQMTSSDISTTVNIANLNVLGQTINPDVNASVGTAGILTGTVDERTATWNSSTGRLDYTVRAVDLSLLSGLSAIGSGSVVLGEATCSGIVKLGTVSTGTAVNLVPGTSGTPTVTVTNTGDVAAPNTVVKIPLPSAAYTVGTPTTTGGGTCTTGSGYITCSGITVPGGGNAQISIPVTLKANAGNSGSAPNWAPGAGTITAVSTPIDTATGPTISISGGGTLVSAQTPASATGSATVTSMNLAAGKTGTTHVTVSNQGPSDAVTDITIPIANRPAGVSVTSAAIGSTPCAVGSSTIVCSGVTIAGGGSVQVDIAAAATQTATVGATWDLSGITANLNGTAVTGQGRLLTITAPDVSFEGGVSITPDTGTPGGAAASPAIKIVNAGATTATGTTITIPDPPTGYTVGAVTTTGGGTCATGATNITCTGVSVPAAGTVTVTVPVTLASGVTANWSAPAGTPVTVTNGTSTGTASGTMVTAAPRYTLGVTAIGPAASTVNPGGSTTMSVSVYDQGPSDAKPAPFVVVAPQNTTFGPLTGTTASLCTALSGATLRCTVSIAASDPATVLSLPVQVSAQADPSAPVTGGCVSRDNDTSCAGAADVALPDIRLRTPLATRLTTALTAATIVPGTSGTGKVTLTSTQDETGMTVAVPVSGLPAGFTVSSATVPGGTCTVLGTITCTGVNLTANTPKTISVQVAVASNVMSPQTWTANGVTVTSGGEQATASGALAGTGTVGYTLTATVGTPAAGTVQPGDVTSLRVVVSNPNGPSDATGAVFTVSAPHGTTFAAPPSPCQLTSGTLVTCTTTVTAGASTPTITLPLVVAANDDPAIPVTGGCVDLDGITGCGTNDVVIPAITLKTPFVQQVSVSADRADVTPGGTATATLHVSAAHGAQSGLVVTVPLAALPTGVTAGAMTGPAGSVCTTLTSPAQCTGVNVADGATADITLAVNALPNATPGATWTATGVKVAVAAPGTDAVTTDQTLARVAAAAVTLTATVTPVASPLLPGATGTLGVSVADTGLSDATGAHVNVIAPPGTTFGPLTGVTAAACTESADQTQAACWFNLAAGGAPVSLSLPVKVDATAVPGQALTGGCVDLNADGVCSGADQTIAAINVATPLDRRIAISTTAAQPAPGQGGNAKVRLTATGTAVTGLTVTVPLTALPGWATVSGPVSDSNGVTCTTTPGSQIVCTGVTVAAGTPTDITIPLTVASSTAPGVTWTTTGITAAAGGETASTNGILATVADRLTAITATAAVPGTGTISAGGTASVSVTVHNGGPSDAPGTSFAVLAPTGTTFDVLQSPTSNTCTRTNPAVITCTTDLATTATSSTLTFPVLVPATADPFTPLTGGCVDLDRQNGCTGNDQPIPAINLAVPFSRLVSVSADPATLTPGSTADTILHTAAPHGALSNLTVTVPLGARPTTAYTVTASTASGACTVTSTQVQCTGVAVGAGATEDITLHVTAPPSATPGTKWTATGITVADTSANSISADRLLATVGAAQSTLTATATAPSPSPVPGATAALSVMVADTGPSDATGASFSVIAPAGATFAALNVPESGFCTVGTPTRVTCTTDLLMAAPNLTLSLPLTIDPAADPATSLTGGCVDLDNDGRCTGSPDVPLPAVTWPHRSASWCR
jgi:hypothetical protein